MPSTAWPSASFSVISRSSGWRSPERARRGADLVGEQQLPARRRPQPVDLVEGALVGDRERCGSPRPRRPRTPPAAGAPRSAGRRRRCRRGPRTRRAAPPGRPGGRPHRPGGGRGRRARPRSPTRQLDRLEVGEPLDLGLEDRAHRRDDDLDRAVRRRRPGVRQPAQHREPAAHGVAARGEPLVRQRLPGGVVGDRGRVQHAAERLDEVLGLAGRRGDGEHGAPGVDQPLDDERPQRRRAGEVEGRDRARRGRPRRRAARRLLAAGPARPDRRRLIGRTPP